MKTRKLKDLEVSAIGVGCMGMSHATGKPMAIDDAVNVLRSAVSMGYTFFDTAKNYGYKDDPHHNEKILGKAFKGIRDRVVIATKCGVDFDYTKDPDVPPLIYDSSPKGIRQSVEGSLQRLQTDYIDLYFQARIDPKVEPEVVASTMKDLIQEGKIRHWGISEVDEAYLKRADAICPICAVENNYNIINRSHEQLIPYLEQHDIGWVAHGPVFKGLLSGNFKKGCHFERDDWRSRLINDENIDRYHDLLIYLQALSHQKGATAGQLAIAWTLQRKPYIVPIPGMRSIERLEENAKAIDICLSDEEMAMIDSLI